MQRLLLTLLSSLALSVTVAACGGGGGGGGALPSTGSGGGGGGSQTQNGTIQGTVYDYASDATLQNVQVALAPYTVGATPDPSLTTTTSAQGTFSITAPAATYLLIIGPNTPTATQATIHQPVTITANTTTTVTAPTPIPTVPPGGATFTAAQTAGELRIMTLDATATSCMTGINEERATNSVPPLVADEYLMEQAIVQTQLMTTQDTEHPIPGVETDLFFSIESLFSDGNNYSLTYTYSTCSDWTFTPPSTWPETINPTNNASVIWFGAYQQGTSEWAAAMWLTDPR